MSSFRRFVVVGTVCALAVMLIGCGRQNEDSAAQPASGSSAAGASVQSVKVKETGVLSGVKVTVSKVEAEKQKAQPAGGSSSRVHVVVNVMVENAAGSPVSLNSISAFKLHDPNGKSYNYSMQSAAVRDPKLDGVLTSGEKKSGWIGFSVDPVPGDWQLSVKLTGKDGELRVAFPFPNVM